MYMFCLTVPVLVSECCRKQGIYISVVCKKKDDHPAKIENIIADEKLVEFFTFRYLSATFVLGRKKIWKTLDFSYFYNGKSVVIYMKKETFFSKMDYFVIIRGISCFNCCKRLFPTHIYGEWGAKYDKWT